MVGYSEQVRHWCIRVLEEAQTTDRQPPEPLPPLHQGNDRNWDLCIFYEKNFGPVAGPDTVPAAPKPIIAEKGRYLPAFSYQLVPELGEVHKVPRFINPSDAQAHE